MNKTTNPDKTPPSPLEELKRALDAGQLSRAAFEIAVTAIKAQTQAIATVGDAAVAIDGDNTGDINTGKQTNINQAESAVVGDNVEIHNGHFIGRDYIQYVINNLQSGENPEEAKSVIALYLYALSRDLTGLKLGDIDSAAEQPGRGREPLELADMYVPLNTTQTIPQDLTLEQWPQSDKAHTVVAGLLALGQLGFQLISLVLCGITLVSRHLMRNNSIQRIKQLA